MTFLIRPPPDCSGSELDDASCPRVFAYGSLLFEPELPRYIVEAVPAVLPRHRRVFDRRSHVRGCPPEHSGFREVDVPAPFTADDWCWSLVLGTVDDPRTSIGGMFLRYHPDAAPALWRGLDAREGWLGLHRLRESAYLKQHRWLWTEAGWREAVVYVTNTASMNHWPDLSPEQAAAILLRATPADHGNRALGFRYLVGVLEALRRLDMRDPGLEEIFHACPSRARAELTGT